MNILASFRHYRKLFIAAGVSRQTLDQAVDRLNLSKEEILRLSSEADPSRNKAYQNWIVLRWKTPGTGGDYALPEDLDTLKRYLSIFEQAKIERRLVGDQANIERYKSLTELVAALTEAGYDLSTEGSKVEGLKEIIALPGVKFADQNDRWVIVRVEDWKSSMKLAEGTNWCTDKEPNAKKHVPNFIAFKKEGGRLLKQFQYQPDASQIQYIDQYKGISPPKDLLPLILGSIPKVWDQITFSKKTGYQDEKLEKEVRNSGDWQTVHYYAVDVRKERLPWAEDLLLKEAHPTSLVIYAWKCVHGRWPEAEDKIVKDRIATWDYANRTLKNKDVPDPIMRAIADTAEHAYDYALETSIGRNRILEEKIATDEGYSYRYARDVLEGRFEQGEPAIATSAEYSYRYARDVLGKKPFPAGEPAIARSAEYSYLYAAYVLYGPFPAGEPAIAASVEHSYLYALFVLDKKPFPAGEKAIATSAEHSINYVTYVLGNKPFPAGEPAIATSAEYSYLYARDVLKGRFELGEGVLKKLTHFWEGYVDFLRSKGIEIPKK